ncbi:MAG: CPBP family intramembrane metalloprotease [Candidatus Brockarchaeota archaeon]|nr:CPBP family intramembrane metalloprotease [Candidatus Brockarchaeota archaeon]
MKHEEHLNRNLCLYFSIAFAFSWLFWIPQALVSTGSLQVPSVFAEFLFSPFNPAAFGPLVSAFSLTYASEGGKGVMNLLKRGVDYSFRKSWLIPIFLLFPVITGSALLLAVISGEALPQLSVLYNPLSVAVGFLYIFFLGGPFQEEWGWRGYALDRLQAKWNALVSSLVLGVIWGTWHLPLFFMSGTVQSQTPIWGFMILILCGTILFTWVYNNTGGSILAMMLLHTMNNLSFFMFPTLETTLGGLYLLILNIVFVTGIVATWGYKKLVRENKNRV